MFKAFTDKMNDFRYLLLSLFLSLASLSFWAYEHYGEFTFGLVISLFSLLFAGFFLTKLRVSEYSNKG